MEIPRGFEVCLKCKEGANIVDLDISPPKKRIVEFRGTKYVYKFSFKCNNCGNFLHHFIPTPIIS